MPRGPRTHHPGLALLALLALLPGLCASNVLRLDPNAGGAESAAAGFELGHLYLAEGQRYTAVDLVTVLASNCQTLGPARVNQVVRHMLASWGMSLNTAATLALRSPSLEALSHEVNGCSAKDELSDVNKEITLNMALAVWPWNVYAAKNLAWVLEWEGNTHVARTLYRQTAQITGDLGSLLHGAFVSPPLLWTKEEALLSHLKILVEAQSLLTTIPRLTNHGTDPSLVVREYQLSWQYTGISPGVVSNVYSRVLLHLFPSLNFEDPFVLPPLQQLQQQQSALSSLRPRGGPLRVGIFSEHEANSSPGLCLMSILPRLSQLWHRNERGEKEADFHFVYLRRTDSATVFNNKMEAIAHETITLDNNPGNHELCRQTIVALRLDVLMFIALPTEKFTVFLAQARLATTQIQFGIGHPVTSGSPAIDYSVVSRDMFLTEKFITKAPTTNVTECLQFAAHCLDEVKRLGGTTGSFCGKMQRLGCITDGETSRDASPSTFYTEQVVLFDSLGYFIDNPLTYYDETRDFDPLSFAFDSPCSVLDGKFQEWGLYPNLTASMIGCRPESGLQFPRSLRSSHIYICIQTPRRCTLLSTPYWPALFAATQWPKFSSTIACLASFLAGK